MSAEKNTGLKQGTVLTIGKDTGNVFTMSEGGSLPTLRHFHQEYCRKQDYDRFIYQVILPAVVLPLLVMLFVTGSLYLRYLRLKLDGHWSIAMNELKFCEPIELLGRGTFGMVVKAEYRGTFVAIKRVLPPSSNKPTIFDSLQAEDQNLDNAVALSQIDPHFAPVQNEHTTRVEGDIEEGTTFGLGVGLSSQRCADPRAFSAMMNSPENTSGSRRDSKRKASLFGNEKTRFSRRSSTSFRGSSIFGDERAKLRSGMS